MWQGLGAVLGTQEGTRERGSPSSRSRGARQPPEGGADGSVRGQASTSTASRTCLYLELHFHILQPTAVNSPGCCLGAVITAVGLERQELVKERPGKA